MIIKFSVDNAHQKFQKVVFGLSQISNRAFDIQKYHFCNLHNVEDGYKITTYHEFNKTELNDVHNLLKSLFTDYHCYYLKKNDFEGCIKEYLFNDGCQVPFKYK